MNNALDIQGMLANPGDGVEVMPTLFAFLVCLVMAFILRRFYEARSYSLTGKSHIASIIPILSAVVFIVIVVVKSSLALSLGLVGALSIVRFRTPIKEPEELVYLFLAIAIGLGYGAGHVLITTILITITLGVVYLWLSNREEISSGEYNFVVNWDKKDVSFDNILEKINEFVEATKLVRLDINADKNMAVLLITPKPDFQFNQFLDALQSIDSGLSVTFYEADTNW